MVVLSLILLMAAITCITHKHWFSLAPQQYSAPHYVHEQKINVRIEGAVEAPGIYNVERGANIQEVLAQAKPASNADTKKMALTKKVRDGQTINVPAKEYITIYLEGAVEHPGAIVVPKGMLMEELIGFAPFTEGADLGKIKQKKRLKEGQIIKIQTEKIPSSTSSRQEFIDNE